MINDRDGCPQMSTDVLLFSTTSSIAQCRRMRNIFDQYSQPENRLTHALVCALNEDKKLLHHFVRWVTGKSAPKYIEIIEQGLPGDPELQEEESVRRGLPDAWLHDGNNWSLLVESKVSAELKIEQLHRHRNTALRCGIDDIKILVIDVDSPRRNLPDYVIFRKWSEIYTWLCKQSSRSEWAPKTARYLEVAESKWSANGYLKEGALTVFSGIPFSDDSPYNYPEAKRLIKLAMNDLRARKDLVRKLNMNPQGPGRGSITGREGMAVWDFLRLKGAKDDEPFTKYPHLTLGLERDLVSVAITVPHGIKATLRRNIVDLGFEGFSELMADINNNLNKVLNKAKGAAPWVRVVQRRYPSQRSPAIVDARLEYDLRTAFSSQRHQSVKVQQEWVIATYEALAKKRANIQVTVGAIFPYRACEVTRSPEIINFIADSWIACKPLRDVMLKA